jgi:hypothetical protein
LIEYEPCGQPHYRLAEAANAARRRCGEAKPGGCPAPAHEGMNAVAFMHTP